MQRLDAVAIEPRPHRVADLGRHLWHVGEAAQQALEVEPGAADEDRQPALLARLGQRP
jgi:hypothetical protein